MGTGNGISGVLASAGTALDEEFALDVRVVEASQPVGGLLLSTSDNCGSTCDGTACTSAMAYPA
ncbi:FxLD family lanthipeptide [Thermomonospora cellulosilytica]|uniref:FxLD family lantipeptide n=1 Tax=Thermomonospora cellulosilytica TaxID=1411118 RepID=A0A7W3MW87_9ACTN|nr:FxLD family lanthipeptide [Thermomonospora cellulosilytica]MBA9003065.1 FxLD family lantipeptide [Thermomonospora cellulosilytica]